MPRAAWRQSTSTKILATVADRDAERTIPVEKRAAFKLGQSFDNGWRRMAEKEQQNMAATKFIEVNRFTGIFRCQKPRRRCTGPDHLSPPGICGPNPLDDGGPAWTFFVNMTATRIRDRLLQARRWPRKALDGRLNLPISARLVWRYVGKFVNQGCLK